MSSGTKNAVLQSLVAPVEKLIRLHDNVWKPNSQVTPVLSHPPIKLPVDASVPVSVHVPCHTYDDVPEGRFNVECMPKHIQIIL